MQFGIRELEQRNGESSVEAFAWDVETNTRQVKAFQVPHKRFTKNWQLRARGSARYLRRWWPTRRAPPACVHLGRDPGDVIDAAVEQCEKTLKARIDVTPELIRELPDRFAEHHVTKEMIEKRIQRRIESIAPAQVVQLKKIYNGLKDGMSTAAEWFEIQPAADTTDTRATTGASALKAGGDRQQKTGRAARHHRAGLRRRRHGRAWRRHARHTRRRRTEDRRGRSCASASRTRRMWICSMPMPR